MRFRDGSLINQLMENAKMPVPVVGMGATELCYTDRHAGTIVAVSANGKMVWFKQDIATRTDTNGMSECQTYEYAPNENAIMVCYTQRANGKWVRHGEPLNGGMALLVGTRQTYHDFSF